SCTWFTPAGALAAYEQGAISLIPPTVRTLDDLARFATIDAALEAARGRVVRARRPEVVIDGDVTTIAYPDNTGTDAPPRQLVLPMVAGGRPRKYPPAHGIPVIYKQA